VKIGKSGQVIPASHRRRRAFNEYFGLPSAPFYRKTQSCGGWFLLGILTLAAITDCRDAVAQSDFSSAPQTNLGPIGPSTAPSQGGFQSQGGFPPAGSPSPGPPNYNSPNYNAPNYNAPNFGSPPGGNFAPATPSFDPYATGNGSGGGFGNAIVTPLGSPTQIGGPSFAPAAPGTGVPGMGGNPSYPNGSLLGGLFSGNWFRGNSNTGVYQGAGFPDAGGFSMGGPPASASPYGAGSIYGTPPGSGMGMASGMPGAGNPQMYGSGPMISPPGPAGFNNNFGNTNGYGAEAFPPSAFPSGSPTSLFPGGLNGNYNGSLLPGGFFSGNGLSAYQLINGPRLRHTFISGGDDQDDLGMNQTDFSLGFAFDNFFYSNRPLRVVPSFSLYTFDGPISTTSKPADLPGSAYAGFLDFGWQTDPNQIIGAELGVRVGSYADFDTFNSDSIRVMGKGLASFRLTPSSTIKAGVHYLDRESVKILPAGGWLWQPDPFTRFDIFFPEPKLAKYWRTVGTQDVWWYLAGEYGGDSWTITRANVAKTEERVDVNQIAVTFGWEWGRSDLIRAGQRTAFIEFGGVFNRELKYESSPHDQDLGEALLIRAGWGY